jgi:hypothetical protein
MEIRVSFILIHVYLLVPEHITVKIIVMGFERKCKFLIVKTVVIGIDKGEDRHTVDCTKIEMFCPYYDFRKVV